VCINFPFCDSVASFYLGRKESKGWEKVGRECKTWEGRIKKRTPGIIPRTKTEAGRNKEDWAENVEN